MEGRSGSDLLFTTPEGGGITQSLLVALLDAGRP